MHVRRIRLAGFMSHAKTEVELPPQGIVLVTGNNGAGKSALMEGVSTATYGQTLRKTSPFQEGRKGIADVEFDMAGGDEAGMDSYRTKLKWTGKTKQHEWRKGGAENNYETNTKSMDALASVVGSFDIWRRTHVFSSSDAASFTAATDAQRKQLLESLLGIDWFDDALKRCRDSLKQTKPRLEGIQREIATLLADIAAHQQDSAKHAAELAALTEPATDESLKARADELRKLVKFTKDEMDQAYAKVHRLQTAGEVEAREAMHLKKKALEMPDECFACGQAISPESKVKVMQAATDKLKEAKVKRADGQKDLKEFEQEVADLKADLDALEAKLYAVNIQESTATQERAHYTYVHNMVQNAAVQSHRLAERQTKLSAEASLAAVDLAELTACSNILGFKGVRAQVLGHALSGIEQMANYWLTRLVGDGISVKLASYKENAKGNTQESISLKVDGAGGGFGYDGASGGERRRIDVAILFALAEVAANAHGTHGTLFFDEVFDALDQDGMIAVTDALIDLSKDRAVVVISHAHIEDLAKVATVRFHVEDGEVVC